VEHDRTFYAFGSRHPVFQPLVTTSPGASLINSGPQRRRLNVVREGTDLHVYSAHSGLWRTMAYPSPPVVTLTHQCAVIESGGTLTAISGYFDDAIPPGIPGATLRGTIGDIVIAQTPGMVWGFSARTNQWVSRPSTGTLTFTANYDNPSVAAIRDAAGIAFFSGITGTFSASIIAPPNSVFLSRFCGAVRNGSTIHIYSPFQGTVTTRTFATTPTFVMTDYLCIVSIPAETVAFSSPLGAYSPPVPGSFAPFASVRVAYLKAIGTGMPVFAYSALTNAWVSMPPGIFPNAVIGGSAVIAYRAGVGYYGFSMHGGPWVLHPDPTPPSAVYVGRGHPIVFQVGPTGLVAFNPLAGAWRGTNVPGLGFASYGVDNESAIGINSGCSVIAFGCFLDHWSQTPALGCMWNVFDSDHLLVKRTPTQVYIYSSFGPLSDDVSYPDLDAFAVRGGRAHLDVSGDPGAVAVLAASLGYAQTPTPFGLLHLDLSSLLFVDQGPIPATRIRPFPFEIPADPAFHGLELHLQGAIVLGASLYLTNPRTITIF
jgi:hypothetical protein